MGFFLWLGGRIGFLSRCSIGYGCVCVVKGIFKWVVGGRLKFKLTRGFDYDVSTDNDDNNVNVSVYSVQVQDSVHQEYPPSAPDSHHLPQL